MHLLHFCIFNIILILPTIFGQYFDITSSERSSSEEELLISDIFDLSATDNPFSTESFLPNNTENVTSIGNTGDIVGNCKCLPNELCETAFLRIKNKDVCKVISDMLCCSLFNSTNTSSVSLITNPKPSESPASNPKPNPLSLIANPIKCGQTNPNGLGFVLNVESYQAKNGEFPWVVSILTEIYKYEQKYNVYRCGGSLIHPKVILTSAGCVKGVVDIESLLVRAGDWETQELDFMYPHQDRKVEKIIIHDRFKPDRHGHDVALLFLDQAFELAENIQAICIKKLNFTSLDMSKCILNGWGKDTFNGQYSPVMKKIDLRLMERNDCLSTLKHNQAHHMKKLSRSVLCTSNNTDWNLCVGDEGSPLVCPIDGTYYQVGVASAHFNCGENNLPSLFSNVSLFNNWIHNRIRSQLGPVRLS